MWERLTQETSLYKKQYNKSHHRTLFLTTHTQCDIPTHASTEFTLCANLTDVKKEQHILEWLECLLNQKSENYADLLPKVLYLPLFFYFTFKSLQRSVPVRTEDFVLM